ncbi:GntR family transcriptional regulator [Gluconacetobacter tumulicola]|uniref:GntR family transcriptional regulator n=1 Tax=Gluconacetobacter tumulicola TaxID=1017177 RepID=A0A7W4JB40_9PROT|nr:GntR family transcriptional regulator [Gluconacetobacter tumulicola]MBB2178014.1 GntR family transcriptional regulator [Gluconacetobacter tumulicola]
MTGMGDTLAATLDAAAPTSLYLQLAADIDRRIGHDPRFMDRLPSEAELCRLYDVSRITVRQALSHLAERGLVVRRHGRGTFVSEVRRPGRQDAIYSLGEVLAAQGLTPETELLAFGEVSPPPDVRAALGVTDRALFLRRRFVVNGKPVAITEVWYPPEFIGQIQQDTARSLSSAMILIRHLGLSIDHADVTIGMQKTDGETARRLDMVPDAALMSITRVTFCTGRGAVECSRVLLSTGRAAFRVDAEGRIEPAFTP